MLAIILSVLSLLVSLTALGWNIYREIALKARVRTSLAVGEWHTPVSTEQKLFVTASNLGPGQVQIQGFTVKEPARRKFPVKYHVLPIEWEHPLNTRLPKMLAVGETLNLVIKYGPDCFLAGGATRIGLTDSFGRTHWTPVKDGKHALEQFAKDYGASPDRGPAA